MLEQRVADTAPNVRGANQSPCNDPSCRQGCSATLRGGRRAAGCVAWHLEQVHRITIITSYIMAWEGAGVLVSSGLVLLWWCPGICLFKVFWSDSLFTGLLWWWPWRVLCQRLSFGLVWGLFFNLCRACEAMSFLDLLEEEWESVLLCSGDVSLLFLSWAPCSWSL